MVLPNAWGGKEGSAGADRSIGEAIGRFDRGDVRVMSTSVLSLGV
jgi:hypothetical protein